MVLLALVGNKYSVLDLQGRTAIVAAVSGCMRRRARQRKVSWRDSETGEVPNKPGPT